MKDGLRQLKNYKECHTFSKYKKHAMTSSILKGKQTKLHWVCPTYPIVGIFSTVPFSPQSIKDNPSKRSVRLHQYPA